MTSEIMAGGESVVAAVPHQVMAVENQLIDELVGRAQAEGLQLTGEGGLLQQLTGRLLGSALEGDLTFDGPQHASNPNNPTARFTDSHQATADPLKDSRTAL